LPGVMPEDFCSVSRLFLTLSGSSASPFVFISYHRSRREFSQSRKTCRPETIHNLGITCSDRQQDHGGCAG
jgi:hypothetical protein